jgi:hypothetical protein
MHNRGVHRRRPVRAPLGRLAPVLALFALAACEVPTSLPKWDTLWIAPGQGTTIGVSSLLPADVVVAPGGDAFELVVPPVTFQETLGEACSSCALLNGLVLPKPAFTLTIGSTAQLPGDVISAKLASGKVDVSLSHDFAFDPLRPSASARGYLLLVARSGSTVLARDSIAGEATAWPSGSTLQRSLSLAPATISGGVEVSVTLFSPAGDPVRIDTNQKVTITAAPSQLRVSEAQVKVANESITATDVDLDLADIDDVVIDHQKGGALLLDIDNPFDVTGSLTLTITAPGTTITRPLTLKSGASTERVELSESELASILGRSPVRLSASGSVSAPAAGATVTPSGSVVIESRLELTIGPKEGL